MSCGPNRFNSFIKPPNYIFKNSCKTHDKNYYNKKGKIKSDFKFLKDMLNDIRKSKTNFFKKIYLFLIAFIYFFSVLIFGFLFYNKK